MERTGIFLWHYGGLFRLWHRGENREPVRRANLIDTVAGAVANFEVYAKESDVDEKLIKSIKDDFSSQGVK
ncbi:MAG: hypothetical protein LBU37_08275 [Tannerellaceae bacterium]|nr:hypothetical protein [Tannerellaceae bacterium]